MQRERRRDPYPWTWEIPLGIGIGVLLIATVGIQVGRALANLVAGSGWTWPATIPSNSVPFPSPMGSAFWSSLARVLAGHADAGLPPVPSPGDLASPALLWACLIVTELLLLAGCSWVGAWGYQRWGPGRMLGMATAAEAESLLGHTRLRQVAKHVRPDLHNRPGAAAFVASVPVHRTAGHDDLDANPDDNIPIGHGMSPWLLPSRRSTSAETHR